MDQRADPRMGISCAVSSVPAWCSGVHDYQATIRVSTVGTLAFIDVLTGARLCESGFIPAGLFTITRWYKRDETSKRYSWFFIGNMLAQAISGLAAYVM